jgi:ABC-type glycerol-3-phosphate transport system substrate-binding protein
MSRLTRILGLAAGVAIAALAVGCGGANDQTAKGGPVTITVRLWDSNQKPVYQKCADAFHQQNPNITVNIKLQNWGRLLGRSWRAASSPRRRPTCSPTIWRSTRSSRRAR